MASVFSQPQMEPEGRGWVPLVIGAVVIGLVLVAIFVFGRPKPAPAGLTVDPYSENLQIGDLKMSTAENFVGGSVNYLEGQIANVGKRTVTGIMAEAIFRNSMGEVVQRETQPVMVLESGMAGVMPDIVPLAKAPLTPNTTRRFRLTFEHISNDWSRGYPELRFVKINTSK